MLTHCLPITSILFRIVPYSNAIILKTKNFFSVFFFHWFNLQQLLNILIKRRLPQLMYFRNDRLSKTRLDYSYQFHLWNLNQILSFFKKRKIVIANVYPKLQTVKQLLTPLSKKRCLRESFDSQNVKGSQTLVKSPLENFYQIFSSRWGKLIWQKSPLSKFEIIWVFVNTLNVDYKCPVLDCENLPFSNPIILKTKNFFSVFLFHWWNLAKIWNIFKKRILS